MRAIVDEFRRAFRMTFNEEVWQALRRGRSHLGWGADRHLRLGFLCAIPVFFGALFAIGGLTYGHVRADGPAALGLALLASLAANLTWLGVAAWSRSRAKA